MTKAATSMKTSTEIEKGQATASQLGQEQRAKRIFATTDRFGVPGQFSCQWNYKLPKAHDWEAMEQPGYWSLIGVRLGLGDVIDVVKDDLTEVGRLIVTESNPRIDHAVVQTVDRVKLAGRTQDTEFFEDGFAAKFEDMHDKWTVRRQADGHVMARGLNSLEDARQYIRHQSPESGLTVRQVRA